jgi:hypothetical protein
VRQIPFSCFALTNSFSAVPRASGPILIFCATGHIFGGTEGVGSRYHVLRSHTSFQRNRASRVPFSCFTLPDSFSAVSRASGSTFMFCALGPIFSRTEGVGSHFHVLRFRTHFHRYRGCRVSFSHFVLPVPFSSKPSASGPVFMFLHFRTRYCRNRDGRVPFSSFALRV